MKVGSTPVDKHTKSKVRSAQVARGKGYMVCVRGLAVSAHLRASSHRKDVNEVSRHLHLWGGGIGLRGEELLSSHVVARRTGSRRERVRRALLDTGGGAPQRNRWICERKSTHAAL